LSERLALNIQLLGDCLHLYVVSAVANRRVDLNLDAKRITGLINEVVRM